MNLDTKEVIKGWRAKLVMLLVTNASKVVLFFQGIQHKQEIIDFDYSYYLGPDYKKTQQLPKYVSTVVANHSSWADNLVELIYYRTSFVAKIEVLNVPFVSHIARALQCIYISRVAGDAGSRDTSLETIGARQR
jgi:lysophosphatidylcholine acyltransferase/lyso-PAF acetyltransferase